MAYRFDRASLNAGRGFGAPPPHPLFWLEVLWLQRDTRGMGLQSIENTTVTAKIV